MKINVPINLGRKVADTLADSQDDKVREVGQKLQAFMDRMPKRNTNLTADELGSMVELVAAYGNPALKTQTLPKLRTMEASAREVEQRAGEPPEGPPNRVEREGVRPMQARRRWLP